MPPFALFVALLGALLEPSAGRGLMQASAGPLQVSDGLQLRKAVTTSVQRIHFASNVTLSLASFPGT